MDKLADFYLAHFTPKELAEYLARFAEAGEQPPLPETLPDRQPIKRRGRPSKEEQQQQWQRLRLVISEHYPVQADLALLAAQSGLARTAVARLQGNLKFLATLPGHLATYFSGLPVKGYSRLTAPWRAVLDLHYYDLARQHPGQRLPLYRLHATLWGTITPGALAHLGERDGNERRRVTSPEFQTVLTQAGWPLVEPMVSAYEGGAGCEQDCPVLRAYFEGADATHIPTVRKLMDLPWGEASQTFTTGKQTNKILRQLIGD